MARGLLGQARLGAGRVALDSTTGVLPTFSLYPDRQRAPLTKGERAVAEIRAKLGSR